MRMEVRASDVKDWFQYRCERKLIYATLPRQLREDIPVDDVETLDLRAAEGIQFERDVVLQLPAEAVLRPMGRAKSLSPGLSKAFVLGERPEKYAYQVRLVETASLREDLALPSHVSISHGFPDLLEWVEEDGRRLLRIVDIKHTRRPTHYHRAQVAFYALMLRGCLKALGVQDPPLHRQANIWFIGDEGWNEKDGLFALNGYEEMIRDFFRRRIGRVAATRIGPGRDESFFHLYFKCEQCKWLHHCLQAVSDDRERASWDISAVPGMSHQSKSLLMESGCNSLESLAAVENPRHESWALRTRGKLLGSRAKALLSGQWERLAGRHTWLMPPRVDVPIFLVVDRDPVDDRLAALGCLVGGKRAAPPRVEVISSRGQELDSIKRIFAFLISTLRELHEANADTTVEAGLRAHIFVYEPSEANDLRTGLANHLDDIEIRSSLINLVRLFPPEEIRAPEPEYRGAHHLPASALRSVVEQLYVLPAKVSYDLARVSEALSGASPSLNSPYRPDKAFSRPFSARLSINVMRQLSDSEPLVRATQGDVVRRLKAMEGLCHWILEDNRRADTSFLRLDKPPFRFQEQFHPLEATDLDVLLAQELLQSRAERLAALVELARPFEERRERLRCFAELTLVDHRKVRGGHILTFDVPQESRAAELAPGGFGLILTDDDPDLRMNPAHWGECSVELLPSRSPTRVRVKVWKRTWASPAMQRLMRGSRPRGWFLDQAHADVNTPRLAELLRYLNEDSHGPG